MIVLEFNFPTGRFHATPWGRHVNEGAVEWPPSPWRILRALIATWYLKATEIREATVRTLLEKLSVPPVFRLPRAGTGHTRHYMPYNEGKNEKTTKVFDTFIQMEENTSLLVAWNVALTDEERGALHILAERLGYFGRAESFVVARLLDGIAGIEANAVPHYDGETLPKGTDVMRLLAPIGPTEYIRWRRDFMAKAPAAPGKKSTAAQKKDQVSLPEDLFAALHADTSELRAAGWNLPPGAQFVDYVRRADAFAPAARRRVTRKGPHPTVARFAVVSDVVPRITQAVSIGDRVHAALCKWSDQERGRASVFTGIDSNGQLLTEHQHAHIFCEANGSRDAVTHITVWAPMGFDEEACRVLRRVNKVWGHGGHDLNLVLHAIGQPMEFVDCPLLGTGKVWRSHTPFVSTLHAKTYRDGRPKLDADGWQQGSAAHDLLRHLAKHPKGTGATIRQIDERKAPFRYEQGSLRSLQFQTCRREGGGRRGNCSGGAFEITFANPISGPLALGYASHFGLGLFVPVA